MATCLEIGVECHYHSGLRIARCEIRAGKIPSISYELVDDEDEDRCRYCDAVLVLRNLRR